MAAKASGGTAVVTGWSATAAP
uniref:Uncharacterized protein n=1 Tax=Anguilla anguilla TaxID=7936 RepID=A0A0E9VCE4_ANGAN